MTEASAFVLDGAAIADDVLARVAEDARALVLSGVTPGLAVVLVGENPASRTYVASKGREAKACGFHSIQHTLPVDTSEGELLTLIQALNADPAVHGILVQLPLPRPSTRRACWKRSRRTRMSTAFTRSMSASCRSAIRAARSIPCTPAGAMILIDQACERLGGLSPAWRR